MKTRLLALLGGCMLILSSCGLLPEEDEHRAAPLVQAYEQEEFQLAYASRGDMVLSTTVECAYVPIQSETLYYTVGGIYYGESFVEVGDSVEKGQLLAQLSMDGIEEALEHSARRLLELEMRLSFVEENRAFALERKRLEMKETPEKLAQALRQVNEQYDLQKRSLEDERYLTQLQMQEYEQKRAERQLRAGITGTVTDVRKTSPGERSVAGRAVITIADSAMSLFRAETPHWDRFTSGQKVVITVKNAEYEAVVTTEEELGLPAREKVLGEPAYVYFALKTPAFDLEGGDRGSLTLVLDTRADVLKVPESAVTTVDGQAVVYYMDENGMKTYKPVEVGLHAERMVEILSGLSDGESVIVN